MGNRAALAGVFASILRHQGRWAGTYTHLDNTAAMIDRHTAEVTCEFPDTGPVSCVQQNRFCWDAETFCGWARETREGRLFRRTFCDEARA